HAGKPSAFFSAGSAVSALHVTSSHALQPSTRFIAGATRNAKASAEGAARSKSSHACCEIACPHHGTGVTERDGPIPELRCRSYATSRPATKLACAALTDPT